MLVLTSIEYRPSYDATDFDPYITRVYGSASETIIRYIGVGTVIKLIGQLEITLQGEHNQVDDEVEVEGPSDLTRLVHLLDSGNYTIGELTLVVKYTAHGLRYNVYTLKDVE